MFVGRPHQLSHSSIDICESDINCSSFHVSSRLNIILTNIERTLDFLCEIVLYEWFVLCRQSCGDQGELFYLTR